jgi:hypothetical protein
VSKFLRRDMCFTATRGIRRLPATTPIGNAEPENVLKTD